MKKRFLSFALAAVLSPLTLIAQPSMVLVGGKVWTNDPQKPWAEAIAIKENRIIAVGTNAEIGALAGQSTRAYKLGGKVVIPGINDAHTHPGAELPAFGLSTGPASTRSDVAAALSFAFDEMPASLWISGIVGGPVMLDPAVNRAWLDSRAPGRKVILRSFTGHGIILSSAALNELAITREVTDPPGGWYGRTANGDLNGRVYEYAQWALQRRLADQLIDRGTLLDSLRAFSDEVLRWGITTVQAMPVTTTSFDDAWRDINSPLRVRHIFFPFAPGETSSGRTNGVKWILDGTPIERGAAVREEYADNGGRGRMNFTSLEPLLASSDQQLLFHAAGDATIKALLAAMGNTDWRAKRVRIEHADGLMPDLTDAAKRQGVVAVLNPTHFFARTMFPPQRGYSRMRSLIDAGIPVAIGSDGPMNPYLNILLATERPDIPSEAVTREQALAAYTSGSAYAEKKEREKGRIAVGMLADIAVLSQDIFTVAADRLPDITSLLTIVDGNVAYSTLDPVHLPTP